MPRRKRPTREPFRPRTRARRRRGRRGDARDPGFTVAAARGARVVYQTLNPPYSEWTAQSPALQAGVLAAAHATGARLVSMENVYMYGRPAGRPLVRVFPNRAALFRLAGDFLVEAHDEWQVSAERRYLSERSIALVVNRSQEEVAKPELLTA